MIITLVRGHITPLITTHEPPSSALKPVGPTDLERSDFEERPNYWSRLGGWYSCAYLRVQAVKD